MRVEIDPNLCIGCRMCEVACALEHEGVPNIRIVFLPGMDAPVPVTCRHCEDAPCIEACPVKAMRREPDGTVVVDTKACIGCGLCAAACPYGIPVVRLDKSVTAKCDLCEERRKKGLKPACVSICPVGALALVEVKPAVAVAASKA